MKEPFVVDSSVGIAWVSPTQQSAECDELLTDVAAGRRFIVPGLWMLEMANVLVVLQRRNRLTRGQSEQARQVLLRLLPVVDDEAPRLALGPIADLANKHGLSVYDATYLELAMRRGLPLASRDEALNRAAAACGVERLL